jgi:hypothetical protein
MPRAAKPKLVEHASRNRDGDSHHFVVPGLLILVSCKAEAIGRRERKCRTCSQLAIEVAAKCRGGHESTPAESG